MSGTHLLPPLSKYYGTFCHQVVSIIVQEFIYYLPCPNIMEVINEFLNNDRHHLMAKHSIIFGQGR
jgi:hypothetical protein